MASVANGALGRNVALAGVHDVLLLFALLVLQDKRASVGLHEFDFDLAEFSVAIAVGGNVRHAVLVPEEASHTAEYVRHFPLKLRVPSEASSHLRKRPELVVALQIVHPLDRAHPAVPF